MNIYLLPMHFGFSFYPLGTQCITLKKKWVFKKIDK
jgi:hypothetical protein